MASSTHSVDRHLCRATFAGALAGIAASFVMTRYHVALSGRGLSGAEEPQSMKPVDGRDDAAMKSADLVSQATTGEPLTRGEKKEVGGPLAHYAFGATVGAIYGAMAELTPQSPLLRGDRFGSALWAGADQLTLPLAGLSPWPLKAYPASTNFQHWTSHLVYGVTTMLTYRLLRRAIG